MTDLSNSNQSSYNSRDSDYLKDSVSIMDMLLIIVRHLKIIIIVPSIICTISIIYVLFYTTPTYESFAKIMSSSSGGRGPSQAVGLAAQFGINLANSQSGTQWVYSDIIQSRTLARALLKRNFNTNMYGPDKSLFQILTYGNDIKPTTGLARLEILAVNRVIKMIGFKNNLKTGVHEISIKAQEPIFASQLVSVLIEELDAHQREYNNSKIKKARVFIEERLLEAKKELEIAEESLKVFRDRNRRIENSPNLLLQEQRLLREVSVLTGVFTTLKQQYETTKIEEVKESDYVIVIDPPEIPIERISPRKKYIVIVNGFIGIGLGLVLAFLIEYTNNLNNIEKDKFKELLELLQNNIIAIIPFIKKNNA